MPKPTAKTIAAHMRDECIAFRVRRLGRSVTRLYENELREHGLTVAQYGLLAAIVLSQPVRARTLAEHLGLDKSTLSRNLRLMEAEGWVRISAGDDGRAQLVSITNRGESILQAAYPGWKRAQALVRDQIGDTIVENLL